MACRTCAHRATFKGYHEYCDNCIVDRYNLAARNYPNDCNVNGCNRKSKYLAEEYMRFKWLEPGKCMYTINKAGKLMFDPICAYCATKLDDLRKEFMPMRNKVRMCNDLRKKAMDKQELLQKDLLDQMSLTEKLNQEYEEACNKFKKIEREYFEIKDAVFPLVNPKKHPRDDDSQERESKKYRATGKTIQVNVSTEVREPPQRRYYKPEEFIPLESNLEPGEVDPITVERERKQKSEEEEEQVYQNMKMSGSRWSLDEYKS